MCWIGFAQQAPRKSRAAGAGNLFGVLFAGAGTDNQARARREAQTYLFCFPLPFSKGGFHVLAPGSVAECPCAGHYPAAGTSCWN